MLSPARSVFDVIYDSPWHHPMACWAAALPILWALQKARPRPGGAPAAQLLWRLMLLCQVAIVADAFCTGALSPLAGGSTAAALTGVLFVVLGDLRYFLIFEYFSREYFSRERVGRQAGPGAGWVGWAILFSLLVPTACWLIGLAAPTLYGEPRRQFLTYEVLFLLLLLVLRAVVLPRRLAALGVRHGSVERGQWLWRLTAFEGVQYGLWALADIIILAGVRGGLLLRLFPNVLYYVAFVPFAYFAAPPSLRRPGRGD
jgi:hypothetical protein